MSTTEKLKGTQTETNLQVAFAGESQARNRYTYFAEVARTDGNDEVAKFFEHCANHEKAHARAWYKLLNDGLSDTKTNLLSAIEGEHYEHTNMYPSFAKIAREEGFEDIAVSFEDVARVEARHEAQCKAVLRDYDKYLYKYPDTLCLDCGHEFIESNKNEKCPICGASSAFFMQITE